MEIVTGILKFAGFIGDGKSGLVVPHDPLHPVKKQRLIEYMGYCWQIFIRYQLIQISLRSRPEHTNSYPYDAKHLVPWALKRAGLVPSIDHVPSPDSF